jgi:hypothetical protein
MPKENKKEENKKIVIIVGAGASCDFVAIQEKKLNENHGDIKFEIWKNTQDSVDENLDKKAQYFLSENNRKNHSFPSGEALIKLIGNPRKIFDIFGNEILDEIYKDFCKKVDLNQMTILDKDLFRLSNYYFKFFFEYLKIPTKHKYFEKKNNIDIEFDIFQESFHNSILRYKKSMESGNFWEPLIPSLEFQDFKKLNSKFNEFRDGDLETAIGFFMRKLEDCFETRYDSKQQRLHNKSLKLDSSNFIEDKLQNLIFKISTSPYLLISRLVNYYHPFSIDELLDSIKTKKIDVLEPLKIKSEDLKTILKYDENDFEKLEEQFRNELIDAGKTLIALFLLRSEKKGLFDNPNPEINTKIWYRHIRNLIINSGKNPKEIKKQIQNFTIISFNYDRSLDYYLRTRLSDYYNEIKERIIYPYGKLADDDWSKEEQNWSKEKYGSFERDGFNPYNKNELEKIKKLGSGLRVIGELDQKNNNFNNKNLNDAYELAEKIKDFKVFKEFHYSRKDFSHSVNQKLKIDIYDLKQFKNQEKNPDIKTEINFILEKYQTLLALCESRKIYFLGFAFHQQNCDLLQLEKFKDNKKIFWTNYDDSISINRKIENIFGDSQLDKKRFYPSIKKGVYDALIHDFNIDFN